MSIESDKSAGGIILEAVCDNGDQFSCSGKSSYQRWWLAAEGEMNSGNIIMSIDAEAKHSKWCFEILYMWPGNGGAKGEIAKWYGRIMRFLNKAMPMLAWEVHCFWIKSSNGMMKLWSREGSRSQNQYEIWEYGDQAAIIIRELLKRLGGHVMKS
jgi:hypothetical protein